MKRQDQRNALPKINWGRGRLSKYASFTGFAAKFCRLNDLSPSRFTEFWHKAVESLDAVDQQQKTRYIARLLDEPLAVVKTVFWGKKLGYGYLSANQTHRYHVGNAAYCPECLKDGFHGYFHECDWLKKCPIHLCDMAREFPRLIGPRFDQAVCQLLSLLDINCPGWAVAEGQYLAKDAIKKQPTLRILLGWHRAVQAETTDWATSCLGAVGFDSLAFHNHGHGYPFRHYDLLLGRLDWIIPIPHKIAYLFVAAPFCADPDVQFFSKPLADEARHVFSQYPLHEWLGLFKNVNFVNGKLQSHQLIAKVAIRDINVRHYTKTCRCEWRIHSESDGWEHHEAGNQDGLCASRCPYEVAQGELQHEWIDLLPTSAKQRSRYWERYEIMATALSKTGLVSIVGRAPMETIHGVPMATRPILKFNWSGQMAILMEAILSKVVISHRDELNYWLRAIELGGRPSEREFFPPNIYLIHREGSGLQLISWPTRGRPET
ncbi:MAG: hypothetical protein NTV43_18200 [Methylococcales bacterium]|nr:hypothetical protein [Methylococcales bacterium]